MSNIELKPCPFCGGKAIIQHCDEKYGEYSHVICNSCGAESKKVSISFEYSSDEKAATLWNRRVTDAVD